MLHAGGTGDAVTSLQLICHVDMPHTFQNDFLAVYGRAEARVRSLLEYPCSLSPRGQTQAHDCCDDLPSAVDPYCDSTRATSQLLCAVPSTACWARCRHRYQSVLAMKMHLISQSMFDIAQAAGRRAGDAATPSPAVSRQSSVQRMDA